MSVPAYVTEGRAELEAVSRQQAQAVPLHGGTILCRVLGKYLMFADGEDFSVTPHMALNGYWESWTTVAIARAVRCGAHVVDVGANNGYFTVLLGDAVGDEGRVLALEPNPRLADLLMRTLEVNGLSHRCHVLSTAASSGQSIARLSVPPHRWADGSLCRARAAADTVVEVPTVTIDEATADWRRVDFVKIDAEGSEEAIWAGMRRTVRRNPSITLVMEFKPSLYADPAGLLASICAEGFVLRCIDDDGGVRGIRSAEALQARPHGDWMLFLTRA